MTLPLAWTLPFVAGLGLLVGSFLNVVVHRVPAGLSVAHPPSACPGCGHQVRAVDNVPVLSWLVLRGRCRDCRSPISARYPLVEAGTALLFAVTAWRLTDPVVLAALLAVVASGIALTLIDLEHQRLPFSITRTAAALVVVVMAVGALVGHDLPPLLPVALSVVLWTAVYGGTWLATRGRGMGLGDVALAPVLGLALGLLGLGPSLVGLGAGFVLGAVVGLGLQLSGRVGRRAAIPHGPFMVAGFLVALTAGDEVSSAYLRMVGLA